MKKASGSLASFNSYYQAIFEDRWQSLREALILESSPIAYSKCLLKPYYMDRASVQVAYAMPPLDYDGICLDMCAAPGGKTLVLASSLGDGNIELQANELSSARRARLINVIDEHLEEKIKKRITVTPYDAAKMAKKINEKYDRILLDSPCSSERHLLHAPNTLKKWTPARIKNLSFRQWALLSSAFIMLKRNGFLIYSTCALLEIENDNVIEKLLKKYENAKITTANRWSPLCQETPLKTKYGYIYFPDIHNGAGPMYFSLITKI